PAGLHGYKMTRVFAEPISVQSGLEENQTWAQSYLDAWYLESDRLGTVTHRDTHSDYARYLRDLVDLSKIRPLTVVVDAGNGISGRTTPAVLGEQVLPGLPRKIIPLYFELDGTFPNHPASPIEPATLVDLQ